MILLATPTAARPGRQQLFYNRYLKQLNRPGLFLFLAAQGFAGVTVMQNVGPGATAWPVAPIVSTVDNPSTQLTVGESFGAATSYSQTFTIAGSGNYSLQSIYLYVGGGTGTSGTATITLNLFDLGGRTAPNP